MRFANNKVEGCENDSMYSHYNSTHQDTSQTQQQHHQQFLGDASGAIPNFVEVDTSQMPLPDGIMFEHIRTFEKVYREHAEVDFYFTFFFFELTLFVFINPVSVYNQNSCE